MKPGLSLLTSLTTLLLCSVLALAESVPDTKWVAPGEGGIVEAVAASENGSVIASSDGSTIKIWSADGRLVRTIYAPANALAIAPNNDTLAAGSGYGIALYSISSGERTAFVPVESSECTALAPSDSTLRFGVYSVAFSPNGLWLVTGGGCLLTTSLRGKGEVKLWRVSDLSFVRTLPTNNYITRSVAWSHGPTAIVAAAGWDGLVVISNPDDGSELSSFMAGTADIAALAFSGDGSLLAAGGTHYDLDGNKTVSLEIFQKGAGNDFSLAHTLTGHTERVTSLSFFYTNQLASGSLDRTVRFWSGVTGNPVYTVVTLPPSYDAEEKGGVQSLTTAGGSLITGGALGDGSLREWLLGGGSEIRKFNYHQSAISDLTYRYRVSGSPDSLMLYSLGGDSALHRWYAYMEDLQYLSPVSFSSTEAFADFSPDSYYAAVRAPNASTNALGVRQ